MPHTHILTLFKNLIFSIHTKDSASLVQFKHHYFTDHDRIYIMSRPNRV